MSPPSLYLSIYPLLSFFLPFFSTIISLFYPLMLSERWKDLNFKKMGSWKHLPGFKESFSLWKLFTWNFAGCRWQQLRSRHAAPGCKILLTLSLTLVLILSDKFFFMILILILVPYCLDSLNLFVCLYQKLCSDFGLILGKKNLSLQINALIKIS